MAKISDSDTTRSYKWFLMEFCGLSKTIEIKVTKVDLVEREISYMVRVPNAPGAVYKTQSLHGIFIGNSSSKEIYAKFIMASGFETSEVKRDHGGTYPSLDWDELLSAIRLSEIYMTQADQDRLFPAA